MENTNHVALYRKWRPRTFDEVCGQDHITGVLKYETNSNQLSHAYLFCGSRGTGKTSCAKILAKAVNCLSPENGNPCGKCAACRAIDAGSTTDVLEMDAASNNGVDNIRDIRDEVNFAPSDLKYRVYIIDEVHMLSTSAFNALLKTLEEPPAHVIFILATTELQKLPSTIISRCQRFDFRRISIEALMSRLQYIAKEENINLDGEAAHLLARLAQGGMRDAISLLELCAGGGTDVTVDRVNEAVGSVGRGQVIRTAKAVANADYDAIFGIIADAVASSKDLTVFWQELMSLYRDMLVFKTIPDASRYLDLTDSETVQLSEVSAMFGKERLIAHCRLLDEALQSMQLSNAVKRTVAELTLVKMSDRTLDTSPEALLSRIAKLEDAVRSGVIENVSVTEKTDVRTTAEKSGGTSKKAETKNVPVNEDYAGRGDLKTEEINRYKNINDASDTENAKHADTQVKKEQREKSETGASGVKKLKTIGEWAEICEAVARKKQALSSLLFGSRAYDDGDGNIVIKLPSAFSKMAIDSAPQKGGKDIIREAISVQLGRKFGENQIIYEVKTVADNSPDETIFDEIDKLNNSK